MVRACRPNDPPWLKGAFADLGVKEVTGTKHNPRVLAMFAVAGHPEIKDDETAWCSGAVNAWFIETGFKGTNNLAARSWERWGKPLDIEKPIKRGAVLIFRRGTEKWQGHVCLLLEDRGDALVVIGGNQSNAVTIATYSRDALIAARWPATVKNSTNIKLGGATAGSEAAREGAEKAKEVVRDNADTIAEKIDTTKGEVMQLAEYLTVAKWLFVALSVAALALLLWRFYTKHLKADPVPAIPDGPSIDDEGNDDARLTDTRAG